MSEPFSHEDRMQAGEAVMTIFDALEQEDVQRHIIEAREAIDASVTALVDQGLSKRDCAFALVGIVMAPILAE